MTGEGLAEADAVAGGLADMRVVQEPVDGRGREGLGHQLVERGGVQIRGQRDRALLVGGVDEAVEPFGSVLGNRQEPYVVNDHELGSLSAMVEDAQARRRVKVDETIRTQAARAQVIKK